MFEKSIGIRKEETSQKPISSLRYLCNISLLIYSIISLLTIYNYYIMYGCLQIDFYKHPYIHNAFNNQSIMLLSSHYK